MSSHNVYTDTLGCTLPTRQPTQILKEWLVPFSKRYGGGDMQQVVQQYLVREDSQECLTLSGELSVIIYTPSPSLLLWIPPPPLSGWCTGLRRTVRSQNSVEHDVDNATHDIKLNNVIKMLHSPLYVCLFIWSIRTPSSRMSPVLSGRHLHNAAGFLSVNDVGVPPRRLSCGWSGSPGVPCSAYI